MKLAFLLLFIVVAATLAEDQKSVFVRSSVGKLFEYKLPDSASVKQSSLPDWLSLDSTTNSLVGVAPNANTQTFSISLTHSNKEQSNLVIFITDSRNECLPSSQLTRAAIQFNTDLSALTPLQRATLLRLLSLYLLLPTDSLHLSLARQMGEHLISGVGDADAKPSEDQAVVWWSAGCGSVRPDMIKLLLRIEADSKSGKLGQSVGHSVISWQVSNEMTDESDKRSGRHRPRRNRQKRQHLIEERKGSEVETLDYSGDEGELTTAVVMPTSSIAGATPTLTRPTPTLPQATADMPKPTSGPIQPTASTPMTKSATTMMPTTPPKPNTPPRAMKSRITFYAKLNEVKKFEIAPDHFTDDEDGDASNLRLELRAIKSTNKWLKVVKTEDDSKHYLYVAPIDVDVDLLGREFDYKLVAFDKGGLNASLTLSVNVKGPQPAVQETAFAVAVRLNEDYKTFCAYKLYRVFEGLKRYHNVDLFEVFLLGLREGSVIIEYSLNSPDYQDKEGGAKCPTDKAKQLISRFSESEKTVSDDFAREVKPFSLASLKLLPKSEACKEEKMFPETELLSSKENTAANEDVPDDFWVTIIMPIVIIIAFLLIAGIVALLLYRRHRSGKMEPEHDSTFLKPRAPVMLDNVDETHSQPLVVDADNSPPPPKYERSSESSLSNSPPSDRKAPSTTDEEENRPLTASTSDGGQDKSSSQHSPSSNEVTVTA